MSTTFEDYLRNEVLADFTPGFLNGLNLSGDIRTKKQILPGLVFMDASGALIRTYPAETTPSGKSQHGQFRVFYADFFRRGNTPYDTDSFVMLGAVMGEMLSPWGGRGRPEGVTADFMFVGEEQRQSRGASPGPLLGYQKRGYKIYR